MKSNSIKSTLAVSLTNYLDAGAIVAGASGLSLWQNYLGLSEVHLGWLNFISANCLGAAIGAVIGGFLADKMGRKFIYTYNLLLYMLGVLLVIVSCNFPMLLTGFFITGISVGIGVPASWTYISENSETENRGRNICISQMSWGFGPMIILLLGMLFAPDGYLFDWIERLAYMICGTQITPQALHVFSSRVVFLSLFAVAFIAWNLQRQLQESQEWKSSNKEQSSTGFMQAFGVLWTNRIAVRNMCFLAFIYLTWNLVASVMGFFSPHICETAGGISNEQANWMNCIQWATVVTITFCVSYIIDKVNHKYLYIFGLIAAIAAWSVVAFIGVSNRLLLWAFVILWGVNSGFGVQIFYALWGSELFPAKFRAGAQGVMFFLVRGVSAIWGLMFAYIFGEDGSGLTIAAYCMILLLLLSLIVGVWGCPQTRGKSLNQITKELYGPDI